MAKKGNLSMKEVRKKIWEEIEKGTIYGIKVIVEVLLMAERAEWLQAQPYERGKRRRGYRNGKYHRTLMTKFGYIYNLAVPRVRKGKMEFEVLEKYKTKPIEDEVVFLFLDGITQKVREIGIES